MRYHSLMYSFRYFSHSSLQPFVCPWSEESLRGPFRCGRCPLGEAEPEHDLPGGHGKVPGQQAKRHLHSPNLHQAFRRPLLQAGQGAGTLRCLFVHTGVLKATNELFVKPRSN